MKSPAMLLLLALAACSTVPGSYVPPVTFGAGFMGFDAHVAVGGYVVPVPVAKSAEVTQPTLVVPPASESASHDAATVVDAKGVVESGATIPVVVKSVAQPTLLIPAKTP